MASLSVASFSAFAKASCLTNGEFCCCLSFAVVFWVLIQFSFSQKKKKKKMLPCVFTLCCHELGLDWEFCCRVSFAVVFWVLIQFSFSQKKKKTRQLDGCNNHVHAPSVFDGSLKSWSDSWSNINHCILCRAIWFAAHVVNMLMFASVITACKQRVLLWCKVSYTFSFS